MHTFARVYTTSPVIITLAVSLTLGCNRKLAYSPLIGAEVSSIRICLAVPPNYDYRIFEAQYVNEFLQCLEKTWRYGYGPQSKGSLGALLYIDVSSPRFGETRFILSYDEEWNIYLRALGNLKYHRYKLVRCPSDLKHPPIGGIVRKFLEDKGFPPEVLQRWGLPIESKGPVDSGGT